MSNTWSDETPQQRESRLAMPEPSDLRCPSGHDSSIPPRHPALIFVACHHYGIDATWHEFCITCGARHEPYMNLPGFPSHGWQSSRPNELLRTLRGEMVTGRASR
jgi:hypothetical protein